MIRFKYIPNDGLLRLIKETVPSYNEDYVYGILREEDRYQLRYRGAYLVCSTKEDRGLRIYDDPLVVIAKNDWDAVHLFFEDTDLDGSVMCQIESRSNKLSVLPL